MATLSIFDPCYQENRQGGLPEYQQVGTLVPAPGNVPDDEFFHKPLFFLHLSPLVSLHPFILQFFKLGSVHLGGNHLFLLALFPLS